MKKVFVIAAVVTVLAGVGGYGLYNVGMRRGMEMAAPAQPSGAADANAGKKILYWHDPMSPAQKFDKPGKSPFMDMDLVPVYADSDDTSKVTVSARLQQNLGVRTAEVTRGTLRQALEAVGSVAYNDRDVALVQARVAGYIERLYVRAPLDPVRQGQPLVEMFAPDWVAVQEEYLGVKRMQGRDVDALLSAARQRMLLVGMSENQVRAIESKGKVQARFTLVAPTTGVIAELGAREGMTVTPGAMLFRINGLGSVWVNAEVPESQSASVRPGAAVEARAAAYPGTLYKGRVAAILPEINTATRTVKVRIELANVGGQLRPGMFATVRFASPTQTEALLVPSEAVIQTGTRSVVVLAEADGKFSTVDVEIGTESNGKSEIRKGLALGQKVVLSGQFLIDSEASLRGTATRMVEPAPAKVNANEMRK